MGYGGWSTNTHKARAAAKRAAGKSTFDYSDTIKRTQPRSAWTVHQALDPKSTNKNGNNAGKNIRESLDSKEHPDSVSIAVIFDVTGSMGQIPRVLQTKLPALHGLLQRKGYVEDPQILFGAVGDANTDRVPLQIGQFESDNAMDEQLENIVLEGGGGGQVHESYELAMYYLARHTEIDSVSKRNKKGYLFLMGDERPYKTIDRRQVKELIGDDLAEDVTTEQIVKELEEKFHVFFLFVREGHYSEEQIMPAWQELLGERALVLDDAEAVCETIGLTLGLMEETTNLTEGIKDLTEESKDAAAAQAASKALAGLK
jgi:hypothetical protein